MKAAVRDTSWPFITYYITDLDSNGNVVTRVKGLEMDLLNLVLKQMNMTFIHVPNPEGFEADKGITNNLTWDMVTKDVYIGLGNVGTHYLIII